MKLTKAQAWPIVKCTFPEYNGRKFRIEFVERVTFYDTNWCGGTRSVYKAISADGSIRSPIIRAPWCNPVEGATVVLPPYGMIVERAICYGRDFGIIIYAHVSHAPKWLEA